MTSYDVASDVWQALPQTATSAASASYVTEYTWNQGLTLVHFSAQPEPFLAHNTSYTPPNTP